MTDASEVPPEAMQMDSIMADRLDDLARRMDSQERERSRDREHYAQQFDRLHNDLKSLRDETLESLQRIEERTVGLEVFNSSQRGAVKAFAWLAGILVTGAGVLAAWFKIGK